MPMYKVHNFVIQPCCCIFLKSLPGLESSAWGSGGLGPRAARIYPIGKALHLACEHLKEGTCDRAIQHYVTTICV